MPRSIELVAVALMTGAVFVPEAVHAFTNSDLMNAVNEFVDSGNAATNRAAMTTVRDPSLLPISLKHTHACTHCHTLSLTHIHTSKGTPSCADIHTHTRAPPSAHLSTQPSHHDSYDRNEDIHLPRSNLLNVGNPTHSHQQPNTPNTQPIHRRRDGVSTLLSPQPVLPTWGPHRRCAQTFQTSFTFGRPAQRRCTRRSAAVGAAGSL